MANNSCDDCTFGTRFYADGFVKKDWSGVSSESEVPQPPDNSKYWTYLECAKNAKKLMHVNLTGNCSVFKKK